MPGDTTRRGYGWPHQKERARWKPQVEQGDVDCARCGRPILPGQPWDLGHVDGTGKQVYSGPEHSVCNRAAGARRRGKKGTAPVPDSTPTKTLGPINVGGPVASITRWPHTDWSDHRWRNLPCEVLTSVCTGIADRLEQVNGTDTLTCWACIEALNGTEGETRFSRQVPS